MKLFLTLSLSTLLLLTCFSSYSQVNSQKRIEFDIKDGFDNEKIYTFGTMGFIMTSRNDETENGEAEWRYELFDTELKSVKSESVKINKKFVADETYANAKGLCTFYRDRKGNFSMVSVLASSLEIKQVEGKLPKKTYIGDMVVLGDYAYLKASIKNRPFLISINRTSGETNLIPLIIKDYKPKRTLVNRMQVLEKTDEVLVYLEIVVKKKKNEMYVIRLNNSGSKDETFHLTKNIDENIIDISGSNIGDNQYVFTGTYSKSNINTSEGLFFCKVDNSSVDFIKFYNYTQLKEFFSYLPEKGQRKVEKKIDKSERKGKEIAFNYLIADHEVLKVGEDFLFLGEAYYPTYRTETTTRTTVSNGVSTTTTQTRQIFDGYQYTHAVLVKYDAKGKLLWDQSFQMWPAYKPFWVKRFISLVVQNNEAVNMVFCSYNRIITKSFSLDGAILSDRKSDPIETGFSGDKSKYSYSNIDYWYEGFFLAYGTQVIKNKEDKSVKRKRKVYFISRIGV